MKFDDSALEFHGMECRSFNLETPWGKAVCHCSGKIVRIERRDGTVGIAVQFSEAKSRAKNPAARSAPNRRKSR